MSKNIRIHADRRRFSDQIDLAISQNKAQGLYAGRPIIMELVEVGSCIEPAVSLSIPQAQELMDELWRCGLRPSEGTGSAGSLAATERHLNDMRAIAMAALKKDGTPL